jgi:hypothetical protein
MNNDDEIICEQCEIFDCGVHEHGLGFDEPSDEKLKHKALIDAAIVTINCYDWQGEAREQYLAEAITELRQAVIALKPDVSWAKRKEAASNHGDEGGRG